MKTTFKSVALFAVVLGISAVVLSGTASAAHGSGSKMGSARSSQINHTPSHSTGSRPQESHKFDSRKYDWDRYCRYNFGRYPYFSSYCCPSWYPCYEPRYYVSQFCVVPQPVIEECPPPCPAPVAEECPAPVCPEPCYSECPPCLPYYAGCDDYGYPGCYDRYWKDHDKWKDHDPKHGSSGKDGPPRYHPLTETQHGTASGNLGKTAMKVAGNSRGGRR